MIAYRAIGYQASADALRGRWFADSVTAAINMVTELEGCDWDDCRVVESEIDETGMHRIDMQDAHYTPDHDAEWEQALAARNIPGVLIENVIGTEHACPCTIILLRTPRSGRELNLDEIDAALEMSG